jgi:hypothetical protein
MEDIMKKIVSVALALLFLLGLSVSSALAYDFLNNTMVQPWHLTNPTGGAYQNARTNPIQGATPEFNTYGANWNPSTHVLTIFSNWGPARDGTLGVTTADLFIDLGCNGTYDFAVGLDLNSNGNGLNRAGLVYSTATYQTSQDLFNANGGVIYGGQVDPTSPHAIPVLAAGGVTGATASPVLWSTLGGLPDYSVSVNLTGLVDGNFGFLWGSGTCGNGPIETCVPIPPSVLLMGSGLLGLGLLGWRRRGTQDQVS